MAKNYITYTHQSPEITSIEDLINTGYSLVNDLTIQELLLYTDDQGVRNLDRLYRAYTLEQQKLYEQDYASGTLTLIVVGTQLVFPKDKLNRETLITEGNQVVESIDSTAFVSRELVKLQKDPNYTQVHILGNRNLGITKDMYPEITVWLWCRALSPETNQLTDPTSLPGTIFDLTPFIDSVNTATAGEAGDWQIQLAPITCEIDADQSWKLKRANLTQFQSQGRFNYSYEDNLNDKDAKRNKFFFHQIIQENDIIFIRFETLKNETLRRKTTDDYEIDKSRIAGNIYDMIGLVDANSLSISPAGNEVAINVTGRDLMKLLIEDGSYFYPEALINQLSNNNTENIALKRTVVNGGFETLFKYTYRPVQFSIKFIINQLANIGICPDDLFISYAGGPTPQSNNQALNGIDSFVDQGGQDRRSQFLTLQDNNLDTAAGTTMRGIWQIIKLAFDSSVANRRVVDQSISFANGSLINYIKKVCQSPWVNFYGDTYGDQYVFTICQSYHTRNQILSILPPSPTEEDPNPHSNVRDEDVLSENLTFESESIYSWYRLSAKINTAGVSNSALAVAPTVFFDRYADIWGSRPLDLETNYIPFIPRRGNKEALGSNYYLQQVIHDLKFMVDSNAYMPFTRKGTITINGDRRYKKGTIIRYHPTGEIFHVDAVSQSYSIGRNGIDRTTTLTVSRGMVEKYIYGGKKKVNTNVANTRDGVVTQEATTEEDLPTYWDIIDTNIEKLFEQKNTDPYQINIKIINNWRVNDAVFNFFLTRRQFD